MVKINTVMWRAKLKETSQTSKALLLSYRMLASLTKLQLLKVLSYLLTFGTNQITTSLPSDWCRIPVLSGGNF